MSTEAGALQIGRYRVGERIASGGMGEVFVAFQLGPGGYEKPVALKLLLPHLARDPQVVQMFLDEARIAARMSHRNIVQLFDVGKESERYYIAMELVHGVTLSRLAKSLAQAGRQLPDALLRWIGRSLCDALEHAHNLRGSDGQSLELVHRDISPQNVLVSDTGELKLVDFGIAKVRDGLGLTQPGLVKGKPEFLAPEQFSSAEIDRRADIYSAGITLFCLATGTSPFHRDSSAATMRAVCDEPLPDLAALRPDLGPALVEAISWAATKDRTRRPPTASALREALPPVGEDAAAELGALVKEHCRAGLKELQHKTRRGTQPITGPAVDDATTTRLDRRSTIRARRTPALVGGALAAAGLVSAAWAVHARAAHVEAPGSAAPLSADVPSPATAPLPAPSPTSASPAPAHPITANVVRDAPERTVKVTAHVHAERRARPATSAQVEPGYLTVDATPWANVMVGGAHVGDTPLHRFPLKPGAATVELRSPDTGKSLLLPVTIRSGQEIRRKVQLR